MAAETVRADRLEHAVRERVLLGDPPIRIHFALGDVAIGVVRRRRALRTAVSTHDLEVEAVHRAAVDVRDGLRVIVGGREALFQEPRRHLHRISEVIVRRGLARHGIADRVGSGEWIARGVEPAEDVVERAVFLDDEDDVRDLRRTRREAERRARRRTRRRRDARGRGRGVGLAAAATARRERADSDAGEQRIPHAPGFLRRRTSLRFRGVSLLAPALRFPPPPLGSWPPVETSLECLNRTDEFVDRGLGVSEEHHRVG